MYRRPEISVICDLVLKASAILAMACKCCRNKTKLSIDGKKYRNQLHESQSIELMSYIHTKERFSPTTHCLYTPYIFSFTLIKIICNQQLQQIVVIWWTRFNIKMFHCEYHIIIETSTHFY